MVEVSVEGDRVVFEVNGWDKLWALRSRLEIPVAHIKGVHADPAPAMGWFQGIKLAGTNMPGIFRAGMFYQDHGIVFWDVHQPERTIVVELEHEHLKKLVVEVLDPEQTVRQIAAMITAPRG